MNSTSGWQPTPAHVRAVVASMVFALVAVLSRRPDLLILATPLGAVAIASALLRPTQTPRVRQFVDHATLREGDATTWHVQVDDHEGRVDDVATLFDAPVVIDQHPADGRAAVSLRDDGSAPLAVVLRPTRWGSERIWPAAVVASSAWNAFRSITAAWGESARLTVLPQPARFDAVAPSVHAPGLVGVNRSSRYGSGTEFATVRPFQPGDRLRRIHWAESLRTGTLHVASTWADHDRHVVLLVDAFEEVGRSGGVDGRASSLDIAVRAAAAIAEHYTRTGDRVSLVMMGTQGALRLAPSSGYGHLRRMLQAMAMIEPASGFADTGRVPPGLDTGALVVALSPLLSAGARQRLVTLADHGSAVVAIDCLPNDIADHDPDDPYAGLAWRIECLERDRELRRIAERGIAVVPWHGPGSIDMFLRGLASRTDARLVRR